MTVIRPVWPCVANCHKAPGLARRKPRLLLRLSGSSLLLLLRFAARAFCALLFHDPPRLTRFEPRSLLAHGPTHVRLATHDRRNARVSACRAQPISSDPPASNRQGSVNTLTFIGPPASDKSSKRARRAVGGQAPPKPRVSHPGRAISESRRRLDGSLCAAGPSRRLRCPSPWSFFCQGTKGPSVKGRALGLTAST